MDEQKLSVWVEKWFGEYTTPKFGVEEVLEGIAAINEIPIEIYHQSWNEKEVSETLNKFHKHLDGLFEAYKSLPPPLRTKFERLFHENEKYFDENYFSYKSGSRYQRMSLIEIIIVLRNFVLGTPPDCEGIRHQHRPIASCTNILDQIRELKPRGKFEARTNLQWKKIMTVHFARGIWEDFTGEDAPISLNAGGCDFGNCLEELFAALHIGADVRAAMNAWHKEMHEFALQRRKKLKSTFRPEE